MISADIYQCGACEKNVFFLAFRKLIMNRQLYYCIKQKANETKTFNSSSAQTTRKAFFVFFFCFFWVGHQKYIHKVTHIHNAKVRGAFLPSTSHYCSASDRRDILR